MLRSNIVALFGLVWSIAAYAQTEPNRQFITSSSPLPDGGRVTTTVWLDAAGNPIAAVTPAVMKPDTSTQTAATSVMVAEPPLQLPGPPLAMPSGTRPVAGGSYMTRMPDPEQLAILQAAQRNRVPSLGFPGTRVTFPQSPATGFATVGNWSGSAPIAGWSPSVAAMRLPSGQVYPYPQPPGTMIQSPDLSANGANIQPAATPLAVPSTTGQPLITLQNMPPGQYAGQGIWGRPTTYVDGQPARNLFRFLFH